MAANARDADQGDASSSSPTRASMSGRSPRVCPGLRAPVWPAIRHLNLFLTVAETRSFTDTACQFAISPSAVAQSIMRLEDMFGGELFVRNRRAPLGLTPVGRAILSDARKIVELAERQMASAKAVATSRKGVLSIGFSHGIATGPLRQGLTAFVGDCAGVDMQLVEAPPEKLYRRLNDRSIDVMITAFLPAMSTPTIARELLWHEPLRAVLPDRHPAAAKPRVGWADVMRSRILWSRHQGKFGDYRTILERAVGRPIDYEEHDVSSASILQLVALDLGVAILPDAACTNCPGTVVRAIDDQGVLVPVEALWLEKDANAIRHRLLRHLRNMAAPSKGGPWGRSALVSHRDARG